MTQLLHPSYLKRIPLFGIVLCNQLQRRIQETAFAMQQITDPDISVVIRSRNNAVQLRMLLEDCRQQDFSGNVEIIVVDTESSDETVAVAREYGATILSITQHEFTYPKALNAGFAAASNKWVFTFVDHSLLSSNQMFKIATYSDQEHSIGGVSGITLPNANASWSELIGTIFFITTRLSKPAALVQSDKLFMGVLPANASLINRDVWEAVGGFDESYAAGGEDSALARTLLQAGYTIIVDPAMAVHHTHGLSLINSIRQFRYWQRLSKPHPFEIKRLRKYRPEHR